MQAMLLLPSAKFRLFLAVLVNLWLLLGPHTMILDGNRPLGFEEGLRIKAYAST